VSEQAVNAFDVRNAGKPWDAREEARLQNLVVANQPMRLIVREFGRPEDEIRTRMNELGLEFDSSVYNPRGQHEPGPN
jgi:hypothetical protein